MDGLNWYTYCGGNPMGAVDPSGLRPDYANASNYSSPPGDRYSTGSDLSTQGARDWYFEHKADEEWNAYWTDERKEEYFEENWDEFWYRPFYHEGKAYQFVTFANYLNNVAIPKGDAANIEDFRSMASYVLDYTEVNKNHSNNIGSQQENFIMKPGVTFYNFAVGIGFHNQHGDINSNSDSYCVYTTGWNAYRLAYYLNTGKLLGKKAANKARKNAIKDGVITDNSENSVAGWMLKPDSLIDSFNKTFGTEFENNRYSSYGQEIPDNLFPQITSDTLIFPFVRYNHSGYAHTTIYMGMDDVWDVYDGQFEQYKGMVTPAVIGYNANYYGANGAYNYGYYEIKYK